MANKCWPAAVVRLKILSLTSSMRSRWLGCAAGQPRRSSRSSKRHRALPSDEGAEWKARDVLNHVSISESGQLTVIQRVLAGQGGVPEDFDLNRYNRRAVQKQAERTVEDMLASIKRDHAQVLAALD